MQSLFIGSYLICEHIYICVSNVFSIKNNPCTKHMNMGMYELCKNSISKSLDVKFAMTF